MNAAHVSLSRKVARDLRTRETPPSERLSYPFGGHTPLLQLLLALLVFLSGAVDIHAQRTTLADVLKAAVLRADETRVYAMLAADTAALDDMLAADCLYVHANGVAQTKPQFLAALKSGQFKYAALRYAAAPQVRLYGDAAVLQGTTQIEVTGPDGKTVKLTLLVTAIYAMLNDRWQLVSYQSTNAATAPGH
ncbi:MAG: nuclear transport factor 2 family protein [Candidatus Didemnitutus sp.]|nr:nuclear transport factor 2 family protein [Candidatus Didemnitutus sp.]